MQYRTFEIYENTKSYAVWSLDQDGRREYLEHEYEGHDHVSYGITGDGVYGSDYHDFESIEQAKKFIDKLLTTRGAIR